MFGSSPAQEMSLRVLWLRDVSTQETLEIYIRTVYNIYLQADLSATLNYSITQPYILSSWSQLVETVTPSSGIVSLGDVTKGNYNSLIPLPGK